MQAFHIRRNSLQRERLKINADSESLATAAETANTEIDPSLPLVNPALDPRDEAVFLLTTAAEVEHALMVQYLYAAYSIRVDSIPGMQEIQDQLLQIAREEMGHLITVQNLLQVLGGPLNFKRAHSPYASDIYPFRFKLQPMSLHSLAKYVIAESPAVLPSDMSEADRQLIVETIEKQAQTDNDSIRLQHVGPIFARLLWLFKEGSDRIQDRDFVLDNARKRARYEDWGYDPKPAAGGDRLVVVSLEGNSAAELRTQSIKAIEEIAEQGEGYELPAGEAGSHFERFFRVYKRVKDISMGGSLPFTWPLPVNPNTSLPQSGKKASMEKMIEMVNEAHAAQGRITNPRSRRWAQLFNLRYRLLLSLLNHFLRIGTPVYEEAGDNIGDRTPRGLLLLWTFNEMRRIRKIALRLVRLKKDDEGMINAGPPFELPYSLDLPEHEPSRWRSHLSVVKAAGRIIDELRQAGQPDEDSLFLTDLARLDAAMIPVLSSLTESGRIPAGALPMEFQKVVHILEEAVRGFTIGKHMNFWDRKLRDEFIDYPFGSPIIKRKADGTFDPDASRLLQITAHDASFRMPQHRPPIPQNRLTYMHDWVKSGCPHNNQVGIERERDDPLDDNVDPTPPPVNPNGQLSFAADIKPLFRDEPDRSVMLVFGLDLHDHTQVSESADRILSRLEDGSMPCDGAWPPQRIAKFTEWIADGKLP